MKTNVGKFALSLVAASILAAPAMAGETAHGKDITAALNDSKVNLNFRARYEGVNQDGIEKNADALTLKSRITVNTGAYQNFSLGLEVDKVHAFVDDYNSKTNGQTEYPVVADPEGTDVNQAFVKYTNSGFSAIVGRQRVLHNNQRFVGGVGWRQNEQTYDGARFQFKTGGLAVDYSFIQNINNIVGGNDKGEFQLANASYKINDAHKVTAFAYFLDYDTATANSSSTYGGLYNGKFKSVFVNASVASQSDNAENETDYSAIYLNAEVGGSFKGFTVLGGYELLGSDDGKVAFNTPLATKHKFNGWADKFLGTPKEGLQDIYLTAKTKISGIKLAATYHDFSSDEGDIDLGKEIDLVASYKINNNYGVLLKFANYSKGDDYGKLTDTNKVWVQMTAKF